MSNKILTNQTNLTSTFYTGSIGHDVSTGVEFTRETQTNYGVNPVTLPAVNIYHPDSSIHPGGLTRNGANANGQTDTFAIYAFDTLQITRDFELNGGSVWIIIILNMTVPPPAAAADAVPSPALLAWQKGSPVTTVDTAKSGNLVNWKAGALYHLTENGNVYINYAVSQQPPGGNNFALAQSGSGNSANRTDFKPQKANTSEIGTKWQVLDKRLLLTAALFRTDIENEVEQNDDGTYSQYGKKRVEGYEISVAGNITPAWQVIGGYTQQKSNHQKRQRCCPGMVPHRCRIPRSTPLPYGASIRQPMISLLVRAHAISAVCIKVLTARWERQRLPKVIGSPTLNWGIGLIAISTSS